MSSNNEREAEYNRLEGRDVMNSGGLQEKIIIYYYRVDTVSAEVSVKPTVFTHILFRRIHVGANRPCQIYFMTKTYYGHFLRINFHFEII